MRQINIHQAKAHLCRLLVAQATIEGFTLLTADAEIARYPGPILKV